jgi:hypothetical protein
VNRNSISLTFHFSKRSGTPLIYKAIPTWFVRVQPAIDRLVRNNQRTRWYGWHLAYDLLSTVGLMTPYVGSHKISATTDSATGSPTPEIGIFHEIGTGVLRFLYGLARIMKRFVFVLFLFHTFGTLEILMFSRLIDGVRKFREGIGRIIRSKRHHRSSSRKYRSYHYTFQTRKRPVEED